MSIYLSGNITWCGSHDLLKGAIDPTGGMAKANRGHAVLGMVVL